MKLLTAYFSHSGMNYTPGGMGRSEADIRRLCPEAEVEDGLSVRGSKVRTPPRRSRPGSSPTASSERYTVKTQPRAFGPGHGLFYYPLSVSR